MPQSKQQEQLQIRINATRVNQISTTYQIIMEFILHRLK